MSDKVITLRRGLDRNLTAEEHDDTHENFSERLDTLESAGTAIDTAIARIDAALEATVAAIAGITTRADTTDAALAAIVSTVQSAETDIVALQAAVAALQPVPTTVQTLASDLPGGNQVLLQTYYNDQPGSNAPDAVPDDVKAEAAALGSGGYSVYLGHSIWWYTNDAAGQNWAKFGSGGKTTFSAPIVKLYTFKTQE